MADTTHTQLELEFVKKCHEKVEFTSKVVDLHDETTSAPVYSLSAVRDRQQRAAEDSLLERVSARVRYF